MVRVVRLFLRWWFAQEKTHSFIKEMIQFDLRFFEWIVKNHNLVVMNMIGRLPPTWQFKLNNPSTGTGPLRFYDCSTLPRSV